MNRGHWTFLALFVVVFGVIYRGLDTKSKEIKRVEKSRVLEMTATDPAILIAEAKKELEAEQINYLSSLEYQSGQGTDDSTRAFALKNLSGAWFSFGKSAIAGYYAARVAEMEKSEEAWSIAGTTFARCVQESDEDRIRSYCAQNARDAFEKAISLNPEEVNHQVNLAVVLAEHPSRDNPMKGIQMLLQLDEKHPEHPGPKLQLARFGMQTGQYEKAEQRLMDVLALEPENQRAICMLGRLYRQTGQTTRAVEFEKKCNSITK